MAINKQIGDRISQILMINKIKQSQFASKIGINQGHLSEVIAGKKGFTNEKLASLIEIYNIDLNWLLTGEGEMYRGGVTEKQSSSDLIKSTYFEEVMASAGNGLINYEEDTKKSLEVSAWVFNTLGVGLPKNELHTIRVFGDSMAPLLNKGDIVFVEPHRNGDILEGEIYVVRFESEIFIKKLQHFPQEERIRLLSINPDYEPMEFKGAELENFSVIGRVIMRLGGV